MMKKIKFLNKTFIISVLTFFLANSFAIEEKTLVEKINYSSVNDFTINYENVSIIEYLQFVSKVCDINFVYDEKDLNFTVSITSKEPITKQTVMSSLMQVLRVNDLFLVEDGKNIIISKSPNVKEIAPIVEKDSKDNNYPIITRILSINNVAPDAVFAIIKEMVSKKFDSRAFSANSAARYYRCY